MSTAPVVAKTEITGPVSEWAVTLPSRAHHDACADALTMFSLDLVKIVAGYVHEVSVNVYGLSALHKAYGKTRIDTAAGAPVIAHAIPLEIQRLLGRDLTDVFAPADCACWEGAERVCDVFDLFLKPQNLSMRKIQILAQSAVHFSDAHNSDSVVKYGNHNIHADKQTSWLLFPKRLISYPATLPRGGFGSPTFDDACFCIFTKTICDGKPYAFGFEPPILSKYLVAMVGSERFLIGDLQPGKEVLVRNTGSCDDKTYVIKACWLLVKDDFTIKSCEAPTLKIPCLPTPPAV